MLSAQPLKRRCSRFICRILNQHTEGVEPAPDNNIKLLKEEWMADISEDMEAFNRVALELFARLYDFFPMPCNIDPILANEIGFAAVPQGLRRSKVG